MLKKITLSSTLQRLKKKKKKGGGDTLFLIPLKWPSFLVEGQLERLIFRLSWSLKLVMVSKKKTYFSTNLTKCQLPSSCLRSQCPKSYNICWLQCVSRRFRGYEITSYSLLHMSSLRNCPLEWVQPLESLKNEDLFQLHHEKVSNNGCVWESTKCNCQGLPGTRSTHWLRCVCFGNKTILEINWGSKCNKRSRDKTLLIKQHL